MKRVTSILIALAVTLTAVYASSNARDADGSRMQARSHDLGDQAVDRLAPPSDVVDWRYIRVKKTKRVGFSVSSTPPEARVTIGVTSATGTKVFTGSTKKGEFKTSKKLEAGLYYISVASRDAVNYELTVE